MSSADSVMRGAGFGLNLIDRKDAKQRQEKQDQRQEVYDARQEVQWEQQDQQFEQNSFLQARRLAAEDLELALKTGDYGKYEQASRALGLSPPAFTSDRYQQHSQTLESYRAGNIRQNDPAMIELFNDVIGEDLKNRPNAKEGWDYRIKTAVPSPDGQGFQFLLEVTDENGQTWEAPLTENATVGSGRVQTVAPKQLLNRVKSYLDIGSQLHSSPESSSAVDQMLRQIQQNDIAPQQAEYMDQQRRGFGLQPLNPQEPDSAQDVWVREFEQHMGRAPTEQELGAQFGVSPAAPSATMQKVQDYMRATNSDTIPTPVLNELFGIDNIGQDDQTKWRYVKEADGHNYWIDGPQAGQRAVPGAGAKPPSGSGGGEADLSYKREIDQRIFELQGIQEDEVGMLITAFPAENRQIQNALSSLAQQYSQGGNFAADADAISRATRGMPLTVEAALQQVAQQMGVDMEENPEPTPEMMEAVQLMIDRNIKRVESTLAAEAERQNGAQAGPGITANTGGTDLFY